MQHSSSASRNRPDFVIGIDPGVNSGIAVVTVSPAPMLKIARKCITSNRGKLISVAEYFSEVFRSIHTKNALAVVEHQYVGKNMQTAIKLAQCAGRWIEVCLMHEIPVEQIDASSWQARELHGILKRKDLKAAAQAKARGLWGITLEPDAADAALIARFRAVQIALGHGC